MTDERDVDALLEESAEELYEHAPAGYFSMLPDGLVVKANETFLSWTGYRREDVVRRKRLHDLLPPGARIYYETHYAPLLQMQGRVREIAVELLRADGTRLPVLMNSILRTDDDGKPLFVRSTVFDATDRRAYERELLRARAEAEERARAALALAHVGDGVLLVGVDGQLELVNPAAANILALAPDRAQGRQVADVLPEWTDVAARVPVGEPSRNAARVTLPLARGGHELWLEVTAIDSGNGVVYTIRDVSADRRLEELRNELVTVVSHELRTPLAGAYGAAQTLLSRHDTLGDAQRRALLEMIVAQAERLTRILDEILLTSRLDAGELLLDIGELDAADVVLKVAAAADATRIDVDVDASLRARGDAERMEQVLAALVDNALKYSSGRVRVAAVAVDGSARFTVADEGPGIPPAESARVFEKFYRLDTDLEQGVGGPGLGLYVARELVRRMNGTIALAQGETGATFVVELPLA